MFDDALGMATLCTENFRDGVRDSFGASMIADVLDRACLESQKSEVRRQKAEGSGQ